MEVVSVNVGLVQEIEWNGRSFRTAIVKEPVEGRRRVGRLNVDGDAQADLKHHGGPEQAVYAYPAEHYDFWAGELGRKDLSWGMFGENLTFRGLLETGVRPGDRLRIGTTELVVTNPRIPCAKLGARFEDASLIKRFRRQEKCGFYLSVAREGELGAGDSIEVLERAPGGPTVVELFRDHERGKTTL